jgi:thioester reductase-like protein
MSPDPVIFLTGATGLFGGEVLKSILVSAPRARVIALVRGDPARCAALFDDALRAEFARRVEPVSGDLEKPDLGLDSHVRAEITGEITHVIHSAASIDFAMPYETAHAINYGGTVRMYDLAAACPHLQAFAHISTAYVSGKRTGVISENDLEHDAGFVNAYECSKYESEQFVRARMGELPIAVYRTVTLIGNAADGAVRQYNYLHHSLRFMYHGLIPVIPAEPEFPVNVVPADWAAAAVCTLALTNFHPGTTYHLCAEPQDCISLREFIDLACQALATSPYSKKRHVPAPPIMASEEFQRMMEQERAAGRADRLEQLMRPFGYFVEQLGLPKMFDAANRWRDLNGHGASVPPLTTYLPKVIDHCLRTDWGRLGGSGRKVHEPTAEGAASRQGD